MKIRPIIKDWFTEKDGLSFCPLRLLLIIGVIFYMGMEMRDAITFTGYNFFGHCKDFASGLAEIIGMGGATVAGKSFTEAP